MNNDLIKEAKNILKHAKEELERGKNLKDDILIRNSAEKGWLASTIASDSLIAQKNLPIPEKHGERYQSLRKIEKENKEIKKLGLSDRLGARDTHLHRECFYNGICEIDNITEELEKVEKYIKDVEDLEEIDLGAKPAPKKVEDEDLDLDED